MSEGHGPPAARAPVEGGQELLACGARVADLVEQADAGRLEPVGGHQAGCPLCRRALRDAATSRAALSLLRTGPPTPPAGLADRVVRRVRDSRPYPERVDVTGDRAGAVAGRLRVGRQVLCDLARAAAGRPGVVVARCSTRGGAGAPLAVDLGLLVDGSTPLPALAAAVRQAVRGALRELAGVAEVVVDLTALDLVGPQLPAAYRVQGGEGTPPAPPSPERTPP